jgi:uncharacterized protein DUF6782
MSGKKKPGVRSQKSEVRSQNLEAEPHGRGLRASPLDPLLAAALALASLLAASSVAAHAPTGFDQTSSPALLATAEQVFQQMSGITGLPIRAPLKKELVSRPQVEKFMTAKIHEDYTPVELHVQEATLKAFGFVSSDFNLEKFLVDFYTEQAAGFYDPDRKTMYIADWAPAEMQALVLAHELTHALQDQNFDLKKFLDAEKDNDDATAARQAVAEGHAMAAMLQKMVEPADLATLPALEPMMSGLAAEQMQQYPVFSSAPYFFRFQALFPYSEGMGFMQKGLGLGGWKRLNAVFLHPPETTKEFFEPAIYFDSESLPRISLPRPPALESAPGYKRLSENILGELGYRALLGQFIFHEEAKSAGSHWLADRYILYERSSPSGYAIVARSRWSSPETALQIFRDVHDILTRKYPELTPDKHSGEDLFIGSAANGGVVLVRRGDQCLWAEGVPKEQVEAMLGWLKSLPE